MFILLPLTLFEPKIFDLSGVRSGRPVVLRAKKKNDKSIWWYCRYIWPRNN